MPSLGHVKDNPQEEKRRVKKKMNKKIMAAFVILMFALTIVGFAYAHWSDSIRINGEVRMGSLTFGFSEIILCEDGKMVDGVIVKPEPKEVGSVDCWLAEPETDVHSQKTVYKKLWINITNAYPEYVAQCTYTLDNAGTIPLDVTLYCVPVDPVDTLTYRWEDRVIVGFIDTNANGVRDGEELAVINIWWDPWFGGQIDPCNSKQDTIIIHIKEPAEMCHTYKFEITIHAQQWDP